MSSFSNRTISSTNSFYSRPQTLDYTADNMQTEIPNPPASDKSEMYRRDSRDRDHDRYRYQRSSAPSPDEQFFRSRNPARDSSRFSPNRGGWLSNPSPSGSFSSSRTVLRYSAGNPDPGPKPSTRSASYSSSTVSRSPSSSSSIVRVYDDRFHELHDDRFRRSVSPPERFCSAGRELRDRADEDLNR
ncbi:hypothetical protein M430DRAFT_274231 [Amorphotheca resinae ATCC 22711]|uniref:Uncharacterized protein n=1 Tax=Amorphotheca resinae ATCC 22711 TaxID=857342 RepID=A0A2T3B5A6_AMORE|nr:hypothetical protein M430DRAFT_274231 [Amorphotheca resinae ATCC 22711]PSS21945.1 hypothetical protein M430DRAFT_274231 [Amorphotheca resinae ATCC 22711]